jgi:hypothetical protein
VRLVGERRTRHVVDYNCDTRVADVARYQASKALLACCVPELEAHGAVVEVHCLLALLVSVCTSLLIRNINANILLTRNQCQW